MVSHVYDISLWSLTVLLFIFGTSALPFSKYEYKYSFKGPYLAQRDGSVPFWNYGGSAIASEDSVRITPSLRSKKGYIWSKNKTNFDSWQIELVFRISGRGRIGADGLALWYTEEPGVEGPVFGSNDKWRGLGVFFDSFDNDNKHNNPYIMAVTNDGTYMFDHPNDGGVQQLAGCLRDYRNKPFPVRAKLEYHLNVLTLLFHNGMTSSDQDYEVCFRVENLFLPKFGHFGVSAATGGLADDHDVLAFLTNSLLTEDQYHTATKQAINEAEQQKLTQEYQDYKDRLDKQKEDYNRENPEAARQKQMEDRPDEWFESDQQRELQQIFTGQSKIFDVMRELDRKMNEIIGRQERALSMLSAVQTNQGGHVPVNQGGAQLPAVATDTIRRHEVDMVLNSQRDISALTRDIKAFVQDIHHKASSWSSGQGQANVAGQQEGLGFDPSGLLNEVRDSLNLVKTDVRNLAAKPVPACPGGTGGNCLSTSVFLVFLGVQLILLLGYSIYKDRKENQAKKFY